MDASTDARLGELLGRYQELRLEDPAATVSALRSEAGPLYPELVTLVGCLDDLLTDGPPAGAASPASPPAPSRGHRRWLLGVGALAILGGVLAWGLRSAPEPGVPLEIVLPASAEVTWNGTSPPERTLPGVHRLAVRHPDFHDLDVDVRVPAGGPHRVVADVVPRDPLNVEAVKALALLHGIHLRGPTVVLPAPVAGRPLAPAAAQLGEQPGDAARVALEAKGLPASVQASIPGRIVLAERLLRCGCAREAYRMARPVSDAHPDRWLATQYALMALWEMDLVQSEEYALLWKRFGAASK